MFEINLDGTTETLDINSWDEAQDAAEEWAQQGSWDEPCYVSPRVTEYDDEGNEVTTETFEVLVGDEPEEPSCTEDEHDWCSPEWLGGCRENPGVWSLGGTQINRVTVCSNCGVYRKYVSESTPGQYPKEPPKTTYEDADEQSIEWVGVPCECGEATGEPCEWHEYGSFAEPIVILAQHFGAFLAYPDSPLIFRRPPPTISGAYSTL